jgi:hypothetical protein
MASTDFFKNLRLSLGCFLFFFIALILIVPEVPHLG